MNQHMLIQYALVCDNALYEPKFVTHRNIKGRGISVTLDGRLIGDVVTANVKRCYVFYVIRNECEGTSEFKTLRGKVRIFVLSEGIKDEGLLNIKKEST